MPILIGSDFTGAQFVGRSSRGARFRSAKFIKTIFLKHDLTAAQFNGAELQGDKIRRMHSVWSTSLQRGIDWCRLYSVSAVDRSTNWPSLMTMLPLKHSMEEEIGGINDLLDRCGEFREIDGDDVVLYFRGESRCFPELRPSVMRSPEAGEAPLRSAEGECWTI